MQRLTKQEREQRNAVLMYAGFLGHQFTVIEQTPERWRVCGEFNRFTHAVEHARTKLAAEVWELTGTYPNNKHKRVWSTGQP